MTTSIFAPSFSESPWWWQHEAPDSHGKDSEFAEADVVVIGSGYAGLSCAFALARAGRQVTVVDAGEIGIGASTRNAGFLSGRAGVSKQIDLEATVGKQRATAILDEADAAFEHLKEIVRSENIHCQLDLTGRFVGAHTPKAYEKLSTKMAEYQRDGGTGFHMVSKQEQHQYVASDYWHGGMFTENAGCIHPSRYHKGLLDACIRSGVILVSQCHVKKIDTSSSPRRLDTSRGKLLANEVVLATNGYTDEASPWHQRRLMPISSTVVATEELGEQTVRELLPKLCHIIDTKRIVCFARPTPDYKGLLFGGRARFSKLTAKQSAEILHRQCSIMFPQLLNVKVTNTWSGRMAFTFDFLPKVGNHDGLHYAIGCNAGCGIVMMSWLGTQAAYNILEPDRERSAFENVPFNAPAFYVGKPWFLPIVGNWWRFRDWLELRPYQVS